MVKFIIFFSLISLLQVGECATYYQYSHDEIDNLATKKASKFEINDEQVHKWDAIIDELSQGNDVENLNELMKVAESDAVELSDHKATLDPLMLKVITLFYPDAKQPQNYQSDAYSEALAQMIFPKVKKQFEEGKATK